MATTLTNATTAAAARAAGQTTVDPQTVATIRNYYRGAIAKALTDNSARAGPLAHDALTLARRFRDHEDTILRFVVDLAVPFTNNQAEKRCPARQNPATHLRRRLAHPDWTSRLRHRPVLPQHSRQMGTRHPRRPYPTLHRPALATTRPRTLLKRYQPRSHLGVISSEHDGSTVVGAPAVKHDHAIRQDLA
jgi:hypothetical protein